MGVKKYVRPPREGMDWAKVDNVFESLNKSIVGQQSWWSLCSFKHLAVFSHAYYVQLVSLPFRIQSIWWKRNPFFTNPCWLVPKKCLHLVTISELHPRLEICHGLILDFQKYPQWREQTKNFSKDKTFSYMASKYSSFCIKNPGTPNLNSSQTQTCNT